MIGHLAPVLRPAPGVVTSWDLLVVAMGSPNVDDSISTMLRVIEAAAARGGRVQVWTCGYATMLTQRGLGLSKPRNALDWNTEHPSTARWVTSFLQAHPDTTRWLSCRFCSDERGAVDHIPQVRLRPAMAFGRHVGESAKTVLVGVN
jgi:hypothetical protein